jgi:hypothetical protein
MVDFGVGLQIERVVSVKNPEFSWTTTPGPDPEYDEPATLLGGFDAEPGISVDGGQYEARPTLMRLEATLRQGGRPAVSFEGRFEQDPETQRETMRLTVPDVEGLGVLDVSVQWIDRCFAFSATARVPVNVIGSAVTGACPDAEDEYFPYIDAVSGPVDINGTTVRLSLNHGMFKYTGGWYAADGPLLGSWDPAAASASGAAGSAARILIGNDDLTLKSLTAQFYRRRDVVESGVEADPVMERSGSTSGDRSIDLRLPTTPGRYVAGVSFEWDSPCASGSGDSVFSLDVS